MTIELTTENIVAFFTVCGIIGGLIKYSIDRKAKAKQADREEKERIEAEATAKAKAEMENQLNGEAIEEMGATLKNVCERLSAVENRHIGADIVLEAISQIQDVRDRLSTIEITCNIRHKEINNGKTN